MQLIVTSSGKLRCVYAETIDLNALGRVAIRRASHVEPNRQGSWIVDLSPVSGPTLGPFARRSEALQAEVHWLAANWLLKSPTV